VGLLNSFNSNTSENFGKPASMKEPSSVPKSPLLPGGFSPYDDDDLDEDLEYLSPAPQYQKAQQNQQQQQQQISQIKDKFSKEIQGAQKKAVVKVIRKVRVVKKVKNS
jgi:hypothetical protein